MPNYDNRGTYRNSTYGLLTHIIGKVWLALGLFDLSVLLNYWKRLMHFPVIFGVFAFGIIFV